jgi:hypothetical protein
MSEFSTQQKEVSESAYEYMLGEILALNYQVKSNDQDASRIERLDRIGYDVGYRLINYKFNRILNTGQL